MLKVTNCNKKNDVSYNFCTLYCGELSANLTTRILKSNVQYNATEILMDLVSAPTQYILTPLSPAQYRHQSNQ